MPLTVAQVVDLPELNLVVRTDDVPLDREVRWVAVSEHLDPTPWLAAGDLLLTTGLALTGTAGEAEGYVDRLVRAGVAALGFGTGPDRLPHRSVPAGLVAAAQAAALAVFEVPEPVPFVALSKAVSRLLSAEEYAEAGAAFDTQRRLVRAALAEDRDRGAESILRVLVRHFDGFACLVEPDGRVRVAQPASAAGRVGEVAEQIERLRSRGLRGSASLSSATEHVSIQPIGIRAVDAYLVVGSPRTARAVDQGVLTLAVSLLAWPADVDPAWHRVLVRCARACGLDGRTLAAVGFAGIDPSHCAAIVVRGQWDGFASASADLVLAPADDAGAWEGFVAVAADGSLPGALAGLATARVEAGVSSARDLTDPANVAQAFAQAHRAVRGTGIHRHEDGPAASLVDLVDAARTAAWATEYLGPLAESDESADLLDTVAAWLACHGQVDAAAHRLGIHRHTVRHRLRRAEALLARSLEDPQVRADLWFAIRAGDA